MDNGTPSSRGDANTPVETFAYWLAVGFGLGKLPKAPGTWGSLAAVPAGWWLLGAGGLKLLVPAIIIVTITGVWAANLHQKISGKHDLGEVVIDEVAGQWLTLAPLALLSPTGMILGDLALAFVAFRFFDILKPWPVNILDQRLKGGRGVMLDDIAAGLYAAITISLVAVLL